MYEGRIELGWGNGGKWLLAERWGENCDILHIMI